MGAIAFEHILQWSILENMFLIWIYTPSANFLKNDSLYQQANLNQLIEILLVRRNFFKNAIL